MGHARWYVQNFFATPHALVAFQGPPLIYIYIVYTQPIFKKKKKSIYRYTFNRRRPPLAVFPIKLLNQTVFQTYRTGSIITKSLTDTVALGHTGALRAYRAIQARKTRESAYDYFTI